MRNKTPNIELPTPKIEFGSCRVGEDSDGEYVPTSKRVYDLEDRLLDFSAKIVQLRSRCRILELGITSQDSCCDVAHLLFPIMGKLKPQNDAEISFTNYEFVSRNYAKQSAGCVLWAA